MNRYTNHILAACAVVCLSVWSLADLRSFPFYVSVPAPGSNSAPLFLFVLAGCLVAFLPCAFLLEKRMVRYQSLKRDWFLVLDPVQRKFIRVGVWHRVDLEIRSAKDNVRLREEIECTRPHSNEGMLT